MTANTITIEVSETTAQIVQALTAKAQGAGKSTEDLLREVKATGHLLMLGFNGADVVLTEGSPSAMYEAVKAEALQAEKAKLRQMLLDGIYSGEAVEVTDETWQARKRDLEKRIAPENGTAAK